MSVAVAPPLPVSQKEIAEMAGRSTAWAHQATKRPDFPTSLGQIGKSKVYDREQVQEWLDRWRAAREVERPAGFVDADDLAVLLNVSPSTIYHWRKAGRVPPPSTFSPSERGKPKPLWSPQVAEQLLADVEQARAAGEGWASHGGKRPSRFGTPYGLLGDNQESHHDRTPGGWMPGAGAPGWLDALIDEEREIDEHRAAGHPWGWDAPEDMWPNQYRVWLATNVFLDAAMVVEGGDDDDDEHGDGDLHD